MSDVINVPIPDDFKYHTEDAPHEKLFGSVMFYAVTDVQGRGLEYWEVVNGAGGVREMPSVLFHPSARYFYSPYNAMAVFSYLKLVGNEGVTGQDTGQG